MTQYEKCPRCGGEVWMVEYEGMHPEHYDGTSEYACKNSKLDKPTCRWRVGRFCGKILQPKEFERRFCTGGSHPMHA